MMKLQFTLVFIFAAFSMFAQSASSLEAKLKKAKSDADKMELKYELAKIYNEKSSTRSKAARYIKDAYLIANEKKDYYFQRRR